MCGPLKSLKFARLKFEVTRRKRLANVVGEMTVKCGHNRCTSVEVAHLSFLLFAFSFPLTRFPLIKTVTLALETLNEVKAEFHFKILNVDVDRCIEQINL